ncbi:MAG TPA: hypothetical protein VNS49_24245, partial [Streptomyces sp.]|nr:hypothetical protein [Streptomyces sp.]
MSGETPEAPKTSQTPAGTGTDGGASPQTAVRVPAQPDGTAGAAGPDATATTAAPDASAAPGAAAVGERVVARLTWQKLTLLPGLIALVLLGTWLWFRGADLDAIARNALADGNVGLRVRQHIEMTAISTFFVLIIAIPLGIALTRPWLRKA